MTHKDYFMSETIISLDLGGTQIRTARLNTDLDILERYETLTLAEEGYKASMERIKQALHKVMPADKSEIKGIGVSAPGPLNPETGVLVAPPNLKGWHNVPLKDILYEEFGVPIYTGNDANVAALAEVARGSAKGYRYAIYITISTGVGSGIINDGRMVLGVQGLGAEAGHLPIVIDGVHVSTTEKEASGTAIGRRVRAQLQEGATSIMTSMVDSIDEVDAKIVGMAAKQGDELAVKAIEYCGFIVGLGIVTLLHLFNPQIIVIGGGVSQVGDLLMDKIKMTVKQNTLDEAYWRDLKFANPMLGGDVSIVGAAALVLTQGGHEDVTQLIKAIG
jgi:glucokinase